MKIAVMGTGGVGGWFGARLALAGEDVTFIARGAHLQAIRAAGLKVLAPAGDMLVRPASATDDPAQVGPVDIVLFAVKLWDTESAAEACRPLVGPATGVVCLQNGVDGEAAIGRVLGAAHAVGGVAHIAALIEAPGVIRQNGTLARLTFGELDGSRSARLERLHAACLRAGFETKLSDAIETDIWEKFVFLVGLSGATSVTRMPIGAILGDPDTRALFVALMEETATVGRARAVGLPDTLIADLMRFSEGLPAAMKASMLGDLERGNRLELPWLSGAVVRLGRELGLATPANAIVYAALKLHAAGHA